MMLPAYLAQYYNSYPDMMSGGDWFWGLLMMLFWVGLIVLVVVLIMRSTYWHENGSRPASDEALSVAKKRYAKGEITKEEYDQLKKDLTEK